MDQNQYQSYQNQEFFQAPPVEKNAAYYRAKAREMLKPCYWYAVLAAFIATLLGGLATSGGIQFNFNTSSSEADPSFSAELLEIVDVYRGGGISALFDAYPTLVLLLVIGTVAVIGATLFSLLVGAPMTLGYQRYCLDVVDGGGKDMSVLFRYFKQGYGKSILMRLLFSLINTACTLPLMAVSFGMLWANRHAFLRVATDEPARQDATAMLLMALVIILVSILTVCISVWVQYRYIFCYMILAEYPEMSVIDAFRNSATLMRGNKWRLFCLELSFFGWILLAVCTYGIGIYFLTPYIQTAVAAFYDDISNRNAAKETEFPSLDPNDYHVDGSEDSAQW